MSQRTIEISVEKKHRDGASVSKERVTAAFDDKEIEQLVQFHESTCALSESALVTKGLPELRHLGYDIKTGWRFEVTPFEWSDVYAALHLARPLILDREPASFENTRNLLARRFDNPRVREHLGAVLNQYRVGHYQPYFQFKVGDTPLFSEDTFKLWLNSAQYHRDPDKRKRLKELEDSIGRDNVHNLIALHLSAKIEAVWRLDDGLVATVLRKLDRLSKAEE